MAMESTPDSGVDIRKAVVAPLLAPCFFSDAAAGSTPQDHKGMGIPNRAALITEVKRPFPRCLATVAGLIKIFNKPATRIPKRIYTDASNNRCQDCKKMLVKMFISFL
jgi:hypothetical protein